MALIVGLFILGLMYIVKADYGSDGEWHGSIVPRQAIDNPGRIATRQDSMQIMPIHIEDNVSDSNLTTEHDFVTTEHDFENNNTGEANNSETKNSAYGRDFGAIDSEGQSGHDRNWDISNDFNGYMTDNNVTYNTSAQYYTESQLGAHNSQNDCWISVYDSVYDVTGYNSKLICGSDQTALYYGDRGLTVSSLNQYFVGYLDKSIPEMPSNNATNSTNESIQSQSGPQNTVDLQAARPVNTPSTNLVGPVNDVRFVSSDFKAPAKNNLWQSIWTWFGFK
jgi:cytochrome b involved in lipid metabolism